MEVTYVRQSLAHLRFGLYNRTLEPGRFRIFRQQCVERAAYRAELWIIGASHALNFSLLGSEGPAFSEILTSTPGALPGEGRIEQVREFSESCDLHHAAGPLRYRVRIDSLTDTEETFRSQEACQGAKETPDRLIYHFPPEEGLRAPPITLIDILQADENALEIQTFHTYPEEEAVVRTHSVVEVISSP